MPCFYKNLSGTVVGPISTSDARRLAAQRVITPETPIAKKPEGPWVLAGKLQGLFDADEPWPPPGNRARPSLQEAPFRTADHRRPAPPPPPPGSGTSSNHALPGVRTTFRRQQVVLISCIAGVACLFAIGAIAIFSTAVGKRHASATVGDIADNDTSTPPPTTRKAEPQASAVSPRPTNPDAESQKTGRDRASEFPLGWGELLQLTGEEGPATKYKRDRDGELQRAEAFYGGSLAVAVTKVDGGFRITVGNEIVVAAFTSQPWFTPAEAEGLVEVYSQYVAKAPRSGEQKNVGRFSVQMQPDPEVPIRTSFLLRAKDPLRSEPRLVEAGSREVQENSIGMQLVLIPSGSFGMGMGLTEGEECETPVHRVEIARPFLLGQTEVTQGQWERVMDTTPWRGQTYVKEGPAVAASWVTWDDAVEFCRKLSEIERKAGKLPAGCEYRLPTEAEWEYACRAGTRTKWSFGNEESHLKDHAWYDANTWSADEQYAHEVGRKKANPWGLYDMHGNVNEWCADWFDKDYYVSSPAADPQGPTAGSSRVFRGGSLRGDPIHCRSARRNSVAPSARTYALGFRVVRELE